jgi:hypothetical protein
MDFGDPQFLPRIPRADMFVVLWNIYLRCGGPGSLRPANLERFARTLHPSWDASTESESKCCFRLQHKSSHFGLLPGTASIPGRDFPNSSGELRSLLYDFLASWFCVPHPGTVPYTDWCQQELQLLPTLFIPVIRYSGYQPTDRSWSTNRVREIKEAWRDSFRPNADPRLEIVDVRRWLCLP